MIDKMPGRLSSCVRASFVDDSGAAAQAREITGLNTFTLDNGLEVFVLENHTVPLARIEVSLPHGRPSARHLRRAGCSTCTST